MQTMTVLEVGLNEQIQPSKFEEVVLTVLAQIIHWLVLTIRAGICLVIGSVFVGLAVMIVRAAWRVSGDDSGEDPELKPPYTKLRQVR